MASKLIYILNTNVIEVVGLFSAVEQVYINDATVTVTSLKDEDGNMVSGESFPVTAAYVAASDGNYRAILTDTLVLTEGKSYRATVHANGGTNRVGHWVVPLRAEIRT